MIDIGELIKGEVERQGLTIEEFAKRIHVSRTNAYGIFKRAYMSTDLLIRISKALNRNFVDEVAMEIRKQLGELPEPSVMANSKLHSLGDIVEKKVDGDLYAGLEFTKEREGLKVVLKEYFESDYRIPLLILETGYTFGAREVVKQVASEVFNGTGSAPCPKQLDFTKIKSLPVKVLIEYIDSNTFDSIKASDERLNDICRVQGDVNKKFVCIIHTDPIVSMPEKKDVPTFDQWGNEMSLFLERNEQFFITIYRWNRSSLLSWAIDAGLHEYVQNYIREHQVPDGLRKDYQLTNVRRTFFEIVMGVSLSNFKIDYPTAQAYLKSEWQYVSDFIAAGRDINDEPHLVNFIQDIIDFNEMDSQEYLDSREPQMMKRVDCHIEVEGFLLDCISIELTVMQFGTLCYLYNQAITTDLKGLDEETIQWQLFPWLEQYHPEMSQALVKAAEAKLADLLAQDDPDGLYRNNIPHEPPYSFDDYWTVKSGLKYNIMPYNLPNWK